MAQAFLPVRISTGCRRTAKRSSWCAKKRRVAAAHPAPQPRKRANRIFPNGGSKRLDAHPAHAGPAHSLFDRFLTVFAKFTPGHEAAFHCCLLTTATYPPFQRKMFAGSVGGASPAFPSLLASPHLLLPYIRAGRPNRWIFSRHFDVATESAPAAWQYPRRAW